MYTLFFDTETTGKPRNYKAPMTDADNWPRLVQLGFVVYDQETYVGHDEFIVIPDGFEIPLEASAIHGITTERALLGTSINRVLEKIEQAIKISDVVIGHNVSFDINVLGAEFIRQGRDNPFAGKTIIDTMTASTNFCAIPGPYGNKWPKLTELWFKLFGTELPQTHTALDDIQNTAKCYFELVRLGVIKQGVGVQSLKRRK